MSLEQLKVSHEEIATPEMIEALKAQYRQEAEALQRDIETDLKEADKIKNGRTRSTAFARYGNLSIESADAEQKAMAGINKLIP